MNKPPSVETVAKKPTKRRKTKQDTEPSAPADETPVEPPSEEPVKRMQVDDVEIVIPVGEIPSGYCSNQCHIKSMTQTQKINLRRFLNGLTERKAKLANGKWVKNGQDAIKWMLENLQI